MQPHLILRFALGLLIGTSAAIVLPRNPTMLNNTTAGNGTLQERTAIYFPGPIPGRSYTRAVHDVRVPDGLTKRTSSHIDATELLVSDGDEGNNTNNSEKGASKRAASAGEATPGKKNDKNDPDQVAEAVTDHTFKVMGQIALGVGIPVLIIAIVVVWYKHHKKSVQKEMENFKKGKKQKGWYGSDGSFTTSKYRSHRMG